MGTFCACARAFAMNFIRLANILIQIIAIIIDTACISVYSRTSIIRPSIIRNLDYLVWQFSFYQIRKWACPSNAHARYRCYHRDMPAYLLRMPDNHVALLFINKVGGSRSGLSIRLSSVFTYPACFWNQGVRIIEVLLYSSITI